MPTKQISLPVTRLQVRPGHLAEPTRVGFMLHPTNARIHPLAKRKPTSPPQPPPPPIEQLIIRSLTTPKRKKHSTAHKTRSCPHLRKKCRGDTQSPTNSPRYPVFHSQPMEPPPFLPNRLTPIDSISKACSSCLGDLGSSLLPGMHRNRPGLRQHQFRIQWRRCPRFRSSRCRRLLHRRTLRSRMLPGRQWRRSPASRGYMRGNSAEG